jgi:hypothetical protein
MGSHSKRVTDVIYGAGVYARPHPDASSRDMGTMRDAGGDNGASIRLDDFLMVLTRAMPAFSFSSSYLWSSAVGVLYEWSGFSSAWE